MRDPWDRVWASRTRLALIALGVTIAILAASAQAGEAFTISGAVTGREGSVLDTSGTEVAVDEASSGNPVTSTTVGMTGRYTVTVPSGTYDLAFTPPLGSGYQTAHVSSFAVTADSELNVTLVPVLNLVSWSGVLRGVKGVPLEGIRLHSSSSGYEDSTTTQPGGSFKLELQAGEFNGIIVEGDRPSNVTEATAPQRIYFQGGLTVTGTDIERDLDLPLTDLTVKTIGPSEDPIPGVQVRYPGNMPMQAEPSEGLTFTYSYSENNATTDSNGTTKFAIPENVTATNSGPGRVEPPAETRLQSTTFNITKITKESTQVVAFAKSGTDVTPPEIKCPSPVPGWHAENQTLSCTASDSGSGLADPEDASFTLSTNVAAGEETATAYTNSLRVCDKADNCAQAGPIGPAEIDRKAPTIAIVPASDGGKVPQGTPLKAEYTCTDSGSGVASCEGSTPDGAQLDTSTLGTHTLTVTSTDAVGNHSSETMTYYVYATDTTPPTISIASPEDGGIINKGTKLTASYTCSDTGSGIASCEGSVPSGSPLDTSTLGEHTLSIAASDVAGNTASRTVHYIVVEPGECGESAQLCETGLGDETPPNLTSLSISPSSVDTSASAETVDVDMHATDNLSGVSAIQVNLSNGSRWISAPAQLTTGTRLHGTWDAVLTLPKGSAEGSYPLSVSVIDNVGNHHTYSSQELETLGFPSAVAETGAGDTTPPQLSGVTATPASVSTCTSAQGTTIGVQASDSSGVGFVTAYLTGPGGQSRSAPATLDEGSATSGHWSASLTLPEHSQQGVWSISIQAGDTTGNSTYISSAQLAVDGFTSAVQQTCAGDTSPPQIIGVMLTPETVDTSGGSRSVVVDVHATDNLSGVGSLQATLSSGGQSQSAPASLQSGGTALDGTWQATITLPRWSRQGPWLLSLSATDQIGNSISLAPSQIEALGLPDSIAQTGEEDDTAPTASKGSISPNSFDTSQHAVQVAVSLHTTDAQSGTELVRVEFTSPSGTQHVYGEANLTSGSPQEGTWTATLEFPQFSQQGSWTPRLELWDAFGNRRVYTAAELSAIFPVVGVAGKPPTITKLSAKKGPAAGGTSVAITGTEFVGVSAVRFGANNASSFAVNSPTSITAFAPPGTSGKVDLSVTTPYGTSAESTKAVFTYANPTVTEVSPSTGPLSGGTAIAIHGSGFATGAGNTIIVFGSTEAASVACSSTVSCTAIAPAAKKASTVDVLAKVGKVKSKKAPPGDQYTYH
jgi:hypothetical protein